MSGVIKGTVSETKTLTGRASTLIAKDGESAYDIACRNGFEGTEEEWLESLSGVGASVDDVIEELGETTIPSLSAEYIYSAPSRGGDGFCVTCTTYEQTDDGHDVAVAEFYGTKGDNPVVLRGIAPGKNIGDAVNKAQLDAAIAGVGGGGSGVASFVVGIDFDWETEEYQECYLVDCSYEDIINAHQNGNTVQLRGDIGDGEMRYFNLVSYMEDSHLQFARESRNGTEFITVDTDSNCYISVSSDGGGSVELDTTLTQAGKAADAKAVGDKLGDIETALDGIIAMQNSLIGGEA